MSDHDKLLDTVGPGDVFGMPSAVTVEFLGRTWHVKSALLDGQRSGALLIQPDQVMEVGAADVLDELMKHAANVLVIATDWDEKVNPDHVAALGVHLFSLHFDAIYKAHMATLAGRGKPS